ncbi:hypothetical protein EXS54_01420 [Patescibacteria group bacterium]|nr:hypothetical protein [Patescibacteria group bacterium]
MLALGYLLISLAAGFTLAYAIPTTKLRFEDRVFLAIPIGFAVAGLLTFGAAMLFGLNVWVIGGVASILMIFSIESWFREYWRKPLKREWRDVRKRVRKRQGLGTFLVYLGIGAMLTYIYWSAIFLQDGSLFAGFGNVWGDWNQHLAQTNSFAFGDNFPPEFNYLSGQKITYPFITNFFSGVLLKGGFDLLWAMKVPGILLALSGLGLLGTFTRITIGRGMWLTPILFYFSGGLGFVNFFTDAAGSHQSFGQFLASQPHNYTQTWGNVPIPNINFINTIYAYLIPQRAFLFGLPLLLGTVSLLYLGLKSKGRDTKLFLAAGLIACLLPLIHTHSLMVLGLLTTVLIPLTWKQLAGRAKPKLKHLKLWLWFVVPILIVALPQFVWLTTGTHITESFRFQYGWTKGSDDLVWFWLKNAGLFIPLILVGLVVFRKSERLLVSLTLGAGLVWLAANFYVFQPWDWDNTKLLVYWFIFSLPIVVLLLSRWMDRGRIAKVVTVLVILSLTAAGLADVSKTLQPNKYKAQLFDQTGIQIGRDVITGTAPHSVWLTSQQVNNPVSVLGGRQVLLGYSGNLWSYGLKFQDRERDVKAMYEAQPGTEELLRQYGVDYVVIGPAERADKGFTVNEGFYQQFPRWKTFAVNGGSGPVNVYDVQVLTNSFSSPTSSSAT